MVFIWSKAVKGSAVLVRFIKTCPTFDRLRRLVEAERQMKIEIKMTRIFLGRVRQGEFQEGI